MFPCLPLLLGEYDVWAALVVEAVDCEALGEPIFKGDALGLQCQRPVLVGWVEHQSIFGVLLIINGAATDEFGAVPIPTGVRTVLAGGTEHLAGDFARCCAMVPTASSASVLLCGAVAGKMPPAPALHALDQFVFLLGGADACAANV